MPLAGLGPDLAVQLAPRRIDGLNRIGNRLRSVLDEAVQTVVFPHITEKVLRRPSALARKTRVCSRKVTHRTGWAGDDNALPTCGLRAAVRRREWATLSEHKWSSFGERRGRRPSGEHRHGHRCHRRLQVRGRDRSPMPVVSGLADLSQPQPVGQPGSAPGQLQRHHARPRPAGQCAR